MEKIVSRIKEICELEELTRDELAQKTGMKYTRWQNLMNNRGKIKSEEIEKLGQIWPEYKIWIAYGEELPEAGQISPQTKRAQQNLDAQGKAG